MVHVLIMTGLVLVAVVGVAVVGAVVEYKKCVVSKTIAFWNSIFGKPQGA